MQVISSKDNEIVKNIRKLKEKKYRDLSNCYVIEGIKLLKEAIEENAKIKQIVICDDCEKNGTLDQKLLYEIAKYNCVYVTEKVFNILTDVANPQGILAVIEKENNLTEINWNEDLILILDNLQDPGNLGTILRTADSANLKQIIVSKNCGDIYNPKVVRATMGAIFRVKVLESENLAETIKEIQKHKFTVLATDLKESKSIYEESYNKTAVVIGNEANGVEEEILELADRKIKIPMLRKNRKLKCFCCNRNNNL
mgnify:FL=1